MNKIKLDIAFTLYGISLILLDSVLYQKDFITFIGVSCGIVLTTVGLYEIVTKIFFNTGDFDSKK